MKVGLSFSRCLLDIIEGRVDIDDVLVIIARTDFDPNDSQSWDEIWAGYHGFRREWSEYNDDAKDDFRNIAIELWERGLIHQPRKFGAQPAGRTGDWLETFLPSEERETNHMAKAAWDQYKVVAGLAGVKMDDSYR